MPKIFVFDVETTGLPQRGPGGTLVQPRVVSIAWLLADTGFEEPIERSYIVRPEGFRIPFEATRIHGISTEYATARGKRLSFVLEQLCADVEEHGTSTAVAHNFDFDFPVVDAEFARLGRVNPLSGLSSICTMKSTTALCRIPRRRGGGFKWPKLEELHVKLFGSSFEGAHDSRADVQATFKCFLALARSRFFDAEFAVIQEELMLPYRDLVQRPCYVFACNQSTVEECLERSLFGAPTRWPLSVKGGDPCVLYNYDTHQIMGIWVAERSGRNQIVPTAWDRRYPYQCKVKAIVDTLYAVPRANLPGLAAGRLPNPLQGHSSRAVFKKFFDLQDRAT